MKIFSESEALKNFELLLEEANRSGAVGVRQENGQTFIIRPELPSKSPFDVPGINLPISTEEIIEFVHEGRREG
jgi:hypothetical protein